MKSKATVRRHDAFQRLVLRWRRVRKIGQQEGADILGIPVRTLQDWEYGKRAPRGLSLRIIEHQFKREVEAAK